MCHRPLETGPSAHIILADQVGILGLSHLPVIVNNSLNPYICPNVFQKSQLYLLLNPDMDNVRGEKAVPEVPSCCISKLNLSHLSLSRCPLVLEFTTLGKSLSVSLYPCLS